MRSYELWSHPQSGERFAFRLDEGRITGCCGPLADTETTEKDLADYRYEELPEMVLRVADAPTLDDQVAEWRSREQQLQLSSRHENIVSRVMARVAARRRARRRH
jgi:hypothetical protein